KTVGTFHLGELVHEYHTVYFRKGNLLVIDPGKHLEVPFFDLAPVFVVFHKGKYTYQQGHYDQYVPQPMSLSFSHIKAKLIGIAYFKGSTIHFKVQEDAFLVYLKNQVGFYGF